MKDYLLPLKSYRVKWESWYAHSDKRVRVIVIALSLLLVYLVFRFFVIHPQKTKQIVLAAEIKELQGQVKKWQEQIELLKALPASPIYQKWLQQRNKLQAIQGKYNVVLKKSSVLQWRNVVENILRHEKNIKLVQIRHVPEAVYNPAIPSLYKSKVFQQQIILTFYSNYFDTVNYLQKLELALPGIHWNRLSYEVTRYPLARVEMEFSIIYEKGI